MLYKSGSPLPQSPMFLNLVLWICFIFEYFILGWSSLFWELYFILASSISAYPARINQEPRGVVWSCIYTFFKYLLLSVCVSVCGCVHVSAEALGCQKKTLGPLSWRSIGGCELFCLGTELKSSASAVHVINHWAISFPYCNFNQGRLSTGLPLLPRTFFCFASTMIVEDR